MARKKRPHRTSPKTPSRVKQRRTRKKARSEFRIPQPHPELVGTAVYGIPELHRDDIRTARLLTGAGHHGPLGQPPLHVVRQVGEAMAARRLEG